jgi:hypothetical protein
VKEAALRSIVPTAAVPLATATTAVAMTAATAASVELIPVWRGGVKVGTRQLLVILVPELCSKRLG